MSLFDKHLAKLVSTNKQAKINCLFFRKLDGEVRIYFKLEKRRCSIMGFKAENLQIFSKLRVKAPRIITATTDSIDITY